MGIHLEVVNFNQLYHRSARNRPKIINDLAEVTEEDKNSIDDLIYRKYQPTDLLSNIPTCECGAVVDGYNIGVTCKNCGTKVTSPDDQNLEPVIWMRVPEGISGLLNPDIYTMLSEHFYISGFDLIRYLADITYHPDAKIPPVVEQLMKADIKRGYNFFVDNFDRIMTTLFNTRPFFKKGVKARLQTLIEQNRKSVFSEYLPLPNRSLLVIEETHLGTFIDPIITDAVDAIRTIVSIDSPLTNYTIREKSNRTIKAIIQLAMFYEKYKSVNLAKKEGIFRKHVFGTRAHWSFRAVISSLTEAHYYRELHIPWGVAMGVFRIHIKNKLFRRGFSFKEATEFMNGHVQRFHPLLEEIFVELIKESPRGMIPCVLQRNPSLERGSAQTMFITRVKSNLNDVTVSMPILSVTGFNADFDGDQLNLTLLNDNDMAEEFEKLAPEMSAFDLKSSRNVAKNISMPKNVIETQTHWYHAAEEVDPDKLKRMEEFFQ